MTSPESLSEFALDLAPRVKNDNPDPRIACALLLDTSSSMAGEPIEQLNRGFQGFCDEIKKDELARKRAEIAVVTFGNVARVDVPFTEARDLDFRRLTASGATPMGGALNLALDMLAAQKQAYHLAGLEYYRPWLFVLTDGAPTDVDVFSTAVERLRQVEAARGVSVFPIGVGPYADLDQLGMLSTTRTPVTLHGLSFGEFFSWLSTSLAAASASNAFGSDDGSVAQAETTEQIPLPPAGWARA
ncbi:VWA domain-containing protein [Micromonospora sp. NPDC050187]|uniref:vWA domain-containing protein n=1 Tax=Micromonospora sp. NPDC050187 TaxID=3364277 RepID=UPI0037A8CD55